MAARGFDDILAEHPVFKGFDAATLALLAGCAKNERFQAGAAIFGEGDPADKVYILREGDVAIEIGSPLDAPIMIETLHKGDVLGWGWMVPPFRCMSDARAISAVRAVSLDAACMRRKCEENPALGYAMFRHWVPHLAIRIRALRMQLLDLYGRKAG